MRPELLVAFLGMFINTDNAGSPEASKSCGPVTAEGYCGILFGMNEETARQVWPEELTTWQEEYGVELDEISLQEEAACHYLYPLSDEPGFAFMVNNGVIRRLDVGAEWVRTENGAHVGMAKKDVLTLYPAATLKPNFYTGDDNIIVMLGNGNKIIFETSFGPEDEKTISTYRVGQVPQVNYVEGCL